MTLRAGFFILPLLMWGMDGLVHPSVGLAASLAANLTDSFAQSEEFPSSAAMAKNANLRASPSLQGTILAVIKEGHVVQVLGKGNSWYQVKTQAGTQGWISGSVMILLNVKEKSDPPASSESRFSVSTEIAIPLEPQVEQTPASPPADSHIDQQHRQNKHAQQNTAQPPLPLDQVSSPASALSVQQDQLNQQPLRRAIVFAQQSFDAVRTQLSVFSSTLSSGTVILGLSLVIGLLSIIVALAVSKRRQTQQLRWAKSELNKLNLRMAIAQQRTSTRSPPPLPPQDESAPSPIANGTNRTKGTNGTSASSPTSVFEPPPSHESHPSQPAQPAQPAHLPVLAPVPPVPPALEATVSLLCAKARVEFSPVEQAVLQTLSAQGELAEHELRDHLGQHGFSQLLTKAIVSDIIHKTNGNGQAWIIVRYQDGHFRYAFQQKVLNVDSSGRGVLTKMIEVVDEEPQENGNGYIEVSHRSPTPGQTV